VIVTEGEKAADAAGWLLPDHVVVTSPGVSKAAGAADWSVLAGRRVTIWPDADDPGEIYAHQVAAILEKLSPAPSGAIVKQPKGVSDGWDADDALTDGWAPAQAANLIAEANPAGRERAAASRSSKPAPRALLFDLLGEAELWHDPERVAYATAPVERHEENHELGSDGLKTGWPGARMRRPGSRRRPKRLRRRYE